MYKIKLTKLAIEKLNDIESKTRNQIINKIEVLKEEPNLRGKPLKGILKEYRSIRAAGQRYRIIYKVEEDEVLVIVINIGIRKDGKLVIAVAEHVYKRNIADVSVFEVRKIMEKKNIQQLLLQIR